MVTQDLNENATQTFYGHSTDTKPTECTNGSRFIEVDTGEEYRFDAENLVWCDFGVVRFDDKALPKK